MRSESLKFLRAIVNAPSPSGYESPAAKLYREYTTGLADRVATDVHGNVIASLNPEAKMKVMLAGHIDEIGFIVQHVSEEGLIYVGAIGAHDSAVPVGQRVWIYGKERVPGVIGRKPVHLQEDDERKKKPELNDLWIDIGAGSRAEVDPLVRLGDVVTFQSEFQMLLKDRATGRGFDNKVGCFIVAEALRLLSEDGGLARNVGIYAVATVQEEIGLRGARTSSYAINAHTGLAVDANHAADYPGVNKARHGQLEIGKGPSISRGPNTNPITFELLERAAMEEGIPSQVIVHSGATGTDANIMQVNRQGMATGLIGVPLRYMHTPCEMLSLADVENCVRLTASYCRLIREDMDFTPF